MLSRFHLILECHGQTDGRTDRIAISISRVSVLTRDKNRNTQQTGHSSPVNYSYYAHNCRVLLSYTIQHRPVVAVVPLILKTVYAEYVTLCCLHTERCASSRSMQLACNSQLRGSVLRWRRGYHGHRDAARLQRAPAWLSIIHGPSAFRYRWP